MRTIPDLPAPPNSQIVIVGGDEVSYGQKLPNNQTWREKLLQEISIDPNCVHFLGKIRYANYLALLQVFTAHIYLTVSFVLTWSMLEAMAAGCLVIGSDTAPVCEVLQHGKNGLLVDFFSPQRIADAVDQVLAHPDRMQFIRQVVRQIIVEQYEVQQSLRQYQAVISGLLRLVV